MHIGEGLCVGIMVDGRSRGGMYDVDVHMTPDRDGYRGGRAPGSTKSTCYRISVDFCERYFVCTDDLH